MGKRILIFLLGGVLLTLGIFLILYYLRFTQLSNFSNYFKNGTQVSSIAVDVSTDISGYRVPSTSVNSQTFQQLLATVGLSSEVQPFIGSLIDPTIPRFISLKAIHIHISDLDGYEHSSRTLAQSSHELIRVNNNILYVAGDLSNNNTILTIPLYVSIGQINSRRSLETVLNQLVITAVYLNFQTKPISQIDNPLQFVDHHLGSTFPLFFTFSKSITSSILWNTFRTLVPIAYAQSCTGSYSCGSIDYTTGCINGGPYEVTGTCNGDGDCDGGQCAQYITNACDKTNISASGSCSSNAQCAPACGGCIATDTCNGAVNTPTLPSAVCSGPCMGISGCTESGYQNAVTDLSCRNAYYGTNARCCPSVVVPTVTPKPTPTPKPAPTPTPGGGCGGACPTSPPVPTNTPIPIPTITPGGPTPTPGPVTVALLVNNSHADPVTVLSVNPVTVSWTTTNATACTADASVATTNWSGAVNPNGGSQSGVGPINSYRTLGIHCTNATSSAFDSVDISPFITGTIKARAKVIQSKDISCSTGVGNSNTYLPTTIDFSPALNPASQVTDTSGSYLTWNSVAPDPYTIFPTPPAGYDLRAACYTNSSAPSNTYNNPSANLGPNETLTWDLGFTLGAPWVQGSGGDMTICQNVSSVIPQTPTSQQFILSGPGGYPGIATYGINNASNTYDFGAGGSNAVSSTKWLAQDTAATSATCTTNWYQYIASKYDISSLPIDFDTPANPLDYSSFKGKSVYRVKGSMFTTQGGWNGLSGVQDGDNVIIFVDGDLTIQGNITITGKAFLAFVVNGSIYVTSNVGNPIGNTTPNIQGIYITNNASTSTFDTGSTTALPGHELLVVKGTVVAQSFTLRRDISTAGKNNNTSPSELFIYDPMLLFSMPSEFQDLHVKWQEVAP